MRAVVVLGEIGGGGLDHRLADLVQGVELGDGLRHRRSATLSMAARKASAVP